MMTFFFTSLSYASLIIPISYVSADGQGKSIGTIKADDTIYGLILIPKLHDLPHGIHGFDVATLPFCGQYGRAAGGHLDPTHEYQHRGPFRGNGHVGDLPVLIVDSNGRSTLPVLAPRLKLEQIKGHALIILAGGDNYSEEPMKTNNSKIRIACGVIPYF